MSKSVYLVAVGDTNSASRDVQLRDLEIFTAVTRTGSFRGAAARLYTSQPAVTRSIARLERGLGVTLFERSSRGVQPTPAGEALTAKARRVINLLAEIRQDPLEQATTTIRLGAAATAAGSFLAPFLAQWIPSHPHTRIHVVEDGAARLARRLHEGEVDLAIVASPISPWLESRSITRVGVRAHFPAGHPLDTSVDGITVHELAGLPVLLNLPSFISAQLIAEEFDRAGVRPNIVYQSSVGQTLGALAEAGMGVALFSESVDLRSSTLHHRPLVDAHGQQLEFHLHIAWRRDDAPQHIREFGMALSTFSSAHGAPGARL